jgi:hypothetical protein
MRAQRYKYCSEVEYAEMLLRGEMYCRTLAYFRDFEDAAARQIIGDEYEGTRIYRPADGLQINNQTQGTSGTLQMGGIFDKGR